MRAAQRSLGSSPLSRGIPEIRDQILRAVRIIPALAGNTISAQSYSASNRDHPRSRGEYLNLRLLGRDSVGSSPLSRGIRLNCPFGVRICGIIPALAGNTSSALVAASSRWDHPRSRGEYARGNNRALDDHGSSPLSRGIPDSRIGGIMGSGIIPALAGNTPT